MNNGSHQSSVAAATGCRVIIGGKGGKGGKLKVKAEAEAIEELSLSNLWLLRRLSKLIGEKLNMVWWMSVAVYGVEKKQGLSEYYLVGVFLRRGFF